MIDPKSPPTRVYQGSVFEVLGAFLKLGVSSFGGPIAHIGYFHAEFVERRRWLNAQAYADIVALCQFLPGPASSQVGFSLGLMRAGCLGGLAAWTGFTLPSAIILVAFAYGAHALSGAIGKGLLHGLQLVAVAIVAQAVWGMARTLSADRPRASISLGAMSLILFSSSAVTQIGTIALGALAGVCLCRRTQPFSTGQLPLPISHRVAFAALFAYLLLLVALPVARSLVHSENVALFEALYRSGALVFGGGHVVLPLLREAIVAPGWLSDDSFLSGYGAAQAIPGPLFSFAAYLGAVVHIGPGGLAGAAMSLIAIFLPGMLILLGTLPFWDALRHRAGAQATMRGVNAAVVGLLAAALYDPIWTSAVKTHADAAIAIIGFVLLTVWGTAPLVVVAISAAWGIAIGAFMS
jgi:chromate transporter